MASFDRLIETRWAYAVLAGLVFLLALPGLFALPTLDRDEGRFAEASSEMMESGDYVVIRYHDDLRNKKPVAIHWFQSVAVSATSGPAERSIADYRLPSMLGAILAAVGTLWAGGALFSRRAAFIGAMLIGTTLLLTTEANIAKTDAAQCGILVLGMGALAHLRAGRGGKWHGVLFWVCLSLGVLLKGPIAPLVCFSAIGALFLWERKFEWARPLLYWVGLSLFCVMTIPWYIAVQIATQGEFLNEAVRVDLGQKLVDAAEGHAGPPGMHTAALPILFWPGTLLLIPGIWLAVTKLWPRKNTNAPETTRTATAQAWEDREAAAWRFVACWVIPSWIVFEIAPTKLVHYTLPMYPALALMAGAAADRWFSTNDWKQGRWISIALFGVVTAVLAIAASPWALSAIRADAASDFGILADRVAATWTQAWDSTGLGLWPTLLIILAAGGTIYAMIKKSPIGLMAGLVACSAIGGVGYRAVVLPNQSWMLATNASLSALKEICALPEGSQQWRASGCEGRAPKIIRAISFAEPSLVFELGNKITLPPDTTTEIPSIAEDNRPAWLINVGDKRGKEALGELVEAAAAADRCIRFARRYAFNYSNGDPSVLVAAVVEPGGCPSGETTPDLRPSSEEEDAPELDR
ncbi:MAG: glycosyltransferase family 39 protein [Hyphomonadaceae bacterium]|nr:glycosyltransferase family 39 protein [Hyphomonadaceae bacterium]